MSGHTRSPRRITPDARTAGLVIALLLAGVAFRLVNIQQPFVDTWSWRNADVAMIADNFYRHGFKLFYPQVNWAGNGPGYVGTEFPLVPFLASILYSVFGVQDWVGRSLSVLFFAFSTPFLFLLVAKISNSRSGVLATAIWALAPLSIFTGRSFMPDMASVSFSLAALYLFSEWLRYPDRRVLFLSAGITTCLAILVKVPAIIIGVPFLYMACEQYGRRLFLRRDLWAFACLALVPSLLWYAHAWNISRTYFPYHFFGEGGVAIVPLKSYLAIARNVATLGLTPPLVAAAVAGIFLRPRTRFGWLFHWWLIADLCFMVLAGHGNRHAWYQLPIVPPAAALAGIAWDRLLARFGDRPWARAALGLACAAFFAAVTYLSYVYIAPEYDSWAVPLLKAGREVDRITPRDALVITVDKGEPIMLYYSRRKGWHFSERGLGMGKPRNSEEAIATLEHLRNWGASYVVFSKYTSWWLEYYTAFREHLDSLYQRTSETEDYVIYDLRAASVRRAARPAGSK